MAKISSSIEQMKGVNATLARFIIDNPREVAGMSLNDLAIKNDVSEASVVRFYKKLGYESYRDFVLTLAIDTKGRVEMIDEEIEVEDDAALVMSKLIGYTITILQEQLRNTDFTQVEQAVDVLLGARRIEIYGSGGNGQLVYDTYIHMLKTGKICTHHTDPYMQIVSASLLTNEDAVIAISHSGRNMDVLQALYRAKETGAKVIVITSHYDSPITKAADLVLFTPFRESVFNKDPLSSRYAILNLLDTLYVTMANRKKEISSNINHVQEVLRVKFEQMKSIKE